MLVSPLKFYSTAQLFRSNAVVLEENVQCGKKLKSEQDCIRFFFSPPKAETTFKSMKAGKMEEVGSRARLRRVLCHTKACVCI